MADQPEMEAMRRDEPPRRRDLLVTASQVVVGGGIAAALWPLLAQMGPGPGTPPPETIDIELGAIEPGATLAVAWRGQPILVRHRLSREIERAAAVRLEVLPDRFARNAALPTLMPATDVNRTKPGFEQWLVVIGVCTHLGCVLGGGPQRPPEDDGVMWTCPCHAARFDTSGRVVSGPARTNLAVPPYRFVTARTLRIG